MKEYGMGDDATIKEIISEVDTIISEVDTDHVSLLIKKCSPFEDL